MGSNYVYVYHTGQRPDGMDFAVARTGPGSPATDLGLFRDKIDAHLFAYDKGGRLHENVMILPSAELGTGKCGWPLTLHRTGPYRGETALMCPECLSTDLSISIRPGGYGTGPGRTWRFGDPGGVEYIECNDCHHASDRTPAKP